MTVEMRELFGSKMHAVEIRYEVGNVFDQSTAIIKAANWLSSENLLLVSMTLHADPEGGDKYLFIHVIGEET